MSMLLLTMAVSCGPVLFSIIDKTPSSSCGPFRNTTNVLHVVPAAIATLPTAPRDALQFLLTPACAVTALVVALTAAFYFFKKAQFQARLARHLERLLLKVTKFFPFVLTFFLMPEVWCLGFSHTLQEHRDKRKLVSTLRPHVVQEAAL
jgi:uncharacterized membrane protein